MRKALYELKNKIKNLTILWVLIAMMVVIAINEPVFLAPLNIITILRQVTMLSILSMGMTFVIISGGIDLSVGSIMAVTGVVAAAMSKIDSMPLIIPIIVAVLVGGAIGLLNGVGIAYGKIPPFIMTLGIMTAIRGLALLVTNATPIINLPDNFIGIAGTTIFHMGKVAVPSMVIFLLVMIVISAFLLKKTVYGKWVYSVGGNEIMARFSGVKTKRVTMSVYILSGLFAGICGVLMASRINSGDSTVAQNFAMDAISATVIGGVSLTGGVGKLWKAIVGSLIIGVLQNGLQIMGISSFVQTIIQGIIIIIAVFADVNMHSKFKKGLRYNFGQKDK